MSAAKLKHDPFAARDTFDTGSGKAGIYRLSKLEDAGLGKMAALPYSIRVLLESLLRNCDGYEVTESGDGVEALELQHYEPLTLPAMRELAARVHSRWSLDGLLVLHRSGLMSPGDPIVLVAVAARHRRDAFAAADFAMDHLKSESWFWKREKKDGEWRWIEPREQDFEDIARWG